MTDEDRPHPGQPNKPHYQAEYDPGSRGRGAGSGDAFVADLQRIYGAGKVKMPQVAQVFSDATTELDQARSAVFQVSAHMESPRALLQLATILDRIQLAAYRSARHTESAGRALVRMADLYASADEGTARTFNQLSRTSEFRGNFTAPTAKVTPPVAPEPIQPPQPTRLGRGAFTGPGV